MPFDDWRAANFLIDNPKHVEVAARRRNFVIPQLAGCLTRIERWLAGTFGRANRGPQILEIVIFVVTITACLSWTRRIRHWRTWFVALALGPAGITRGITLRIARTAGTTTAITSAATGFTTAGLTAPGISTTRIRAAWLIAACFG